MGLINYYQDGAKMSPRRAARIERRQIRRGEAPQAVSQQPAPLKVNILPQMTGTSTHYGLRQAGPNASLLQKREVVPQQPVYDNFNQQFAQARKAGLQTFDYRGKSFGTQLAQPAPAKQSKGPAPRVVAENPPNPWAITFPPTLGTPSNLDTSHALGGTKSTPNQSLNVPPEMANKSRVQNTRVPNTNASGHALGGTRSTPTQSLNVPLEMQNGFYSPPAQGIPYPNVESPWRKTIPQTKQKKRSPIAYRQIETQQ